jgi:NAD(P)-dependent dehydrogenase (short-subunit alcohol dehydrogenase family)
VVTGAARGIGRATALGLAAAGATVIATDIVEPQTGAFAGAGSERTSFRTMDVTDESAWSEVVSALEPGPLDVLVNNAGGLISAATLHEHSVEDWQQTLELNLTSVFLGMRAVIPMMLAAGGGSIVNIASVSGVVGQPDAPAYQAAKAGVGLLTRNAAVTYAAHGIRVNAISPSVIATPGLGETTDERTTSFLRRVPMGRAGLGEDVAAAVVYLAGDGAAYVTGANIPVDGGYLA